MTAARFLQVFPPDIWQDKKKGVWSLDSLKALARRHALVRISSSFMYDPEHPDHLGRLRGTLWELHPVTERR
jgi:hypothetical protein